MVSLLKAHIIHNFCGVVEINFGILNYSPYLCQMNGLTQALSFFCSIVFLGLLLAIILGGWKGNKNI